MASRAPAIAVVAALIMAAAHLASGGGYYPAAAPFTTSDWQDGSATFYGDDSGLGADFGTYVPAYITWNMHVYV
jgi:hypothetical protein